MELRLLTLPGCPAAESTKVNLKEVLSEFNLEVECEIVDVKKLPEFPSTFFGSPTLNYRGAGGEWQDLFGQTGEPSESCRIYMYNGEATMTVPKGLLRDRFTELIQNES